MYSSDKARGRLKSLCDVVDGLYMAFLGQSDELSLVVPWARCGRRGTRRRRFTLIRVEQ